MNLNFDRRGLVIPVYMFRFLLIFVKLSVQTWKIHNTNWDVLYKKDNLNIFILEPTKPLLFDKLHRLLGQPIYYRNTLYIVLNLPLVMKNEKPILKLIVPPVRGSTHPRARSLYHWSISTWQLSLETVFCCNKVICRYGRTLWMNRGIETCESWNSNVDFKVATILKMSKFQRPWPW